MGAGGHKKRNGRDSSPFREDLVEEPKNFWHVKLNVLEVQEVLIVLLL